MPGDPSQPGGVLREQALQLMLAERGAAVLAVADGDTSMVPHLRGGDAVLAVPLVAPPGAGDLLLYRQQDYWVVHRCLGWAVSPDGRRGLRTRGDGRNEFDPRLASEDVRARVVALRRGGAWRSLQGAPARAYARLIAWHDLFFAAAGILARQAGLRRAVAAIDRGTLRFWVSLVFPLVHRRIAPPAVSGPERTV
jgi:hypothetical protein